MNFSDPRMMALLSAGGALLQSSGASPRPISMAEGLGNAIPLAIQGAQTAQGFQLQEMLQKKAHDQALQQIQAQEFLQKHQEQGTDPRKLIQQAAMSANPFLMNMAGNMAKALPKVKTTEKVMKDGNAFTRPVFDDGTFGDVSDMPVASQMSFQNLGDKTIGVNPYTGQPLTQFTQGITPGQSASLAQSARHHADSMGMQAQNQNIVRQNADFDRQYKMLQLDPQFQAERAVTKQKALNTAQAQKDLPGVLDKANESINLIDNIIGNKDRNIPEHPGLRISVGTSAPVGSATAFIDRGSNAADFARRMEQIGGQQFLQAFESLKGGGAITEIEGQKATQAISRMNTASSEPEFIKAAEEFRDIIRKGADRAKSAAGVSGGNADGWGELR